jgi:hypothetical protein
MTIDIALGFTAGPISRRGLPLRQCSVPATSSRVHRRDQVNCIDQADRIRPAIAAAAGFEYP